MKAKELREKTDQELGVELTNSLKEYQNLKFKKVVGVVDNPLRVRLLKRDISRFKTILHERELDKIKKEIGKTE